MGAVWESGYIGILGVVFIKYEAGAELASSSNSRRGWRCGCRKGLLRPRLRGPRAHLRSGRVSRWQARRLTPCAPPIWKPTRERTGIWLLDTPRRDAVAACALTDLAANATAAEWSADGRHHLLPVEPQRYPTRCGAPTRAEASDRPLMPFRSPVCRSTSAAFGSRRPAIDCW